MLTDVLKRNVFKNDTNQFKCVPHPHNQVWNVSSCLPCGFLLCFCFNNPAKKLLRIFCLVQSAEKSFLKCLSKIFSTIYYFSIICYRVHQRALDIRNCKCVLTCRSTCFSPHTMQNGQTVVIIISLTLLIYLFGKE